MVDRMTRPSQERRLVQRGAPSFDAIPANRHYDLTQFLLPKALDDEATERWIARQQLPQQVRGLGLEFALHDVLRRRWHRLMEHLSAGLTCIDDDAKRVVKISTLMEFEVWHATQRMAAGFVDGNCFRWFSFDVMRPLPSAGLISRLLRSEFTYELAIPEHLLRQTLPEARKSDKWKTFTLKYFPRYAFDYAGTRIVQRMKFLFLDRPFNELLCRALALDRNDLLNVLRARPARTERFALNSFFWDRCMLRREQLRAVAAARPLLLPLFGAILKTSEIPEDATPEYVLRKLSIYPSRVRFRYQREPNKLEIF